MHEACTAHEGNQGSSVWGVDVLAHLSLRVSEFGAEVLTADGVRPQGPHS